MERERTIPGRCAGWGRTRRELKTVCRTFVSYILNLTVWSIRLYSRYDPPVIYSHPSKGCSHVRFADGNHTGRCGGAARRRSPSSRVQTAPALRAHRIGAAGRRGAGRLPGRCVPGPCRSGSAPGLGRRDFDRRHQRCDHCRKSAGSSRRQASRVLGAGQLSTDAMAGTFPPCSQRRRNGGQSARRGARYSRAISRDRC
jgi:hypothetical protein